ncbi:hypothetical protein SAMN02799625_05060 [Methylobacterium sp. UNC300MFChir4.1]|uniref:hypothetical protein n=1 Tax=unclassified Methylobacterium TaxID=2615210 RepID=UPI0008A77738|nr:MULTISPECIES: hypothetical protein [unclassified Methylobacterium]SEI04189.1 hypothetical protein SAMN02799636_05108 [Methylobacterium sp. 275MFSha3.1]SEP22209.1 hypothetical protein SAMN02799625_05060 [Methylobacterium sp. UNC300MFChir4.1]
MARKHISLVLAALVSSGCSIKPIPDTVTGFSTYRIAERVKCEAQGAVAAAITKRLRDDKNERGLEIANLIDRDPRNVRLLKDYSRLPEIQRKSFGLFDDTIAVFDFQLRMTESNNLGGGTNLGNPITTGLNLVGLKLSDNKERQNFRTFRITTNIVDLMFENCDPVQQYDPKFKYQNFEYPIAGRIGLDETFQTYFEIAFTNKLGPLKELSGQSPFVDTIKFTTFVSGEISTGIAATPAGRGYQFRDANLAFGASRRDEHQLIVGLSLPEKSKESGGPKNTALLVNRAVDRSITKLQLFGLNPLNPFGPLNDD